MGRFAATVCTNPEVIDRLEQLVTLLPSDMRVRIIVHDGQSICGTVVERPALQLLENAAGEQGFNGVVRIDDPAAPPWTACAWLSDIREVDHPLE